MVDTSKQQAFPMPFPHSLSVVIPTYKEEHRLPQTLREILDYLVPRFPKFEVIIVDDNSPDGTPQIVAGFTRQYPQVRLITHPGKIGKGAAVRHGCIDAHCDYVLFMDADHATPIAEVETFFPHLTGQAEGAVVGVRPQETGNSRVRRLISLTCKLLSHLIVFQKSIVDSQCGFKLFTATTAARLFPYARVNGGMIDVELFFLMHKLGVPCHFVPVTWKNKSGSRINFIACAMRDPTDLLRIRLRNLTGLYERPVDSQRQPWNTRT
jgi:dolichyl-phosphate beta-glucosyltransferase